MSHDSTLMNHNKHGMCVCVHTIHNYASLGIAYNIDRVCIIILTVLSMSHDSTLMNRNNHANCMYLGCSWTCVHTMHNHIGKCAASFHCALDDFRQIRVHQNKHMHHKIPEKYYIRAGEHKKGYTYNTVLFFRNWHQASFTP